MTAILAPDGTAFATINSAARAECVGRKVIQRRLKNPDSGWRYAPGHVPGRVVTSHPRRRVVSPRGTRYESAQAAATAYNRAVATIRGHCLARRNGWHYEDDPPTPRTCGIAMLDRLGPIYADEATGRHPRERAVWLMGGGA